MKACFSPASVAGISTLGRRSAAVINTLRQATLSQIEERFEEVLPAALFGQNHAKEFSRDRVYPLSRTLWGWIWQVLQANTSCREVVRQVQALFALHDAGPVDESTSGYCQARRKVPHALLQKLFAQSFLSVQAAMPKSPKAPLEGRPLRVVDGSGTRLQNTPANREDFPPSSNVKEGAGFPYMRVVVLFCSFSGALLAQATGSLTTSETRLMVELLVHLQKGDILLGDNAYGSYVMVALLKARGVDLLSSVRTRTRRVDFRTAKKRFGAGDALFVWEKPKKASPLVTKEQWENLPKQFEVRLLKAEVKRAGFRTARFVIVTTLLDAELYPAEEIIATHARRWRVEMCLDDLKTTLGMEEMSCKSPEMVKRELLVFLTAYNLVRWIMASAAAQENVEIERLSFKGTLDGFRAWSQAATQCQDKSKTPMKLWKAFLRVVAADEVPLRPGRSEPRAVKKRSKYPYLNGRRRKVSPRRNRSKRRRIARAKQKPCGLT